ncbi:hypothetical protein BCEN4_1840013 [Burkholderia cenocepacia]|nr:hypothetical protein BCEN4_1840013 [Burkholderia cenocepacia]
MHTGARAAPPGFRLLNRSARRPFASYVVAANDRYAIRTMTRSVVPRAAYDARRQAFDATANRAMPLPSG